MSSEPGINVCVVSQIRLGQKVNGQKSVRQTQIPENQGVSLYFASYLLRPTCC